MAPILIASHQLALQGLILAAGQSLRFKTGTPKLNEKLCGQSIVLYPIKLLAELDIPTTIVVGHQRDTILSLVKDAMPQANIEVVVQNEQHGTAHAVACTHATWNREHILVINGDMPLVGAELISKLYEKHLEIGAAASFIVAHNPDPTLESYNPIIAKDDHIEFAHKQETTHEQCCIDAGIYIFKRELLISWLKLYHAGSITIDMYCNDIVQHAIDNGCKVSSIIAPFDQIREINTPQDLWVAQQIKRAEIIRSWMQRGVVFNMPHTVHIDLGVTIGTGTRIGSGVHLLGSTSIGSNCSLGEFSIIEDSTLLDNVTIHSHTVITQSTIAQECHVGPFAHIRPGTTLDQRVTVGNFVEVNRSSLGIGTKAKHLTYLGDADIKGRVNIGAGTITCNHDSINKHPTVIQEGAYIGSNTTMVAPVIIGQRAFIAAGSVVTEDVPADALAIARSRQTNKPGYAQKIREQAQQLYAATHPAPVSQSSKPETDIPPIATDSSTITTDTL